QRLEEEFDQEVLELAMARVRQRVQPRTWEVFQLMAVEGLSGAEAAARLGLKVTHAFVYKSKGQKMIREEIAKLENDPSLPGRGGLRRNREKRHEFLPQSRAIARPAGRAPQ